MTNTPTYRAYRVEDGGQGDDTSKGRWTEIGAAWPHKDGKGFSVTLQAWPLDGRIVLREPKKRESAEE